MTEEKRTHVTVEFKSRRLGMYLEPADDENRGAALIRFEQVDGGPGEAESTKVLRPGFRIVAINDVNLTYAQFPSIIAALVSSARPVRSVSGFACKHERATSLPRKAHMLGQSATAHRVIRAQPCAKITTLILALLLPTGHDRLQAHVPRSGGARVPRPLRLPAHQAARGSGGGRNGR